MSEHAGPANRILVLGMAIVVVGFAALLTSCARTPAPPAMAPGKHKVTVRITVESGVLHAHPKTVVLSLGQNEYIEWECKGLSCTMDFDSKDTPFSAYHFAGDGAPSDVPVVKGDLSKTYKYTVKVQGYSPLDPDVIVEN